MIQDYKCPKLSISDDNDDNGDVQSAIVQDATKEFGELLNCTFDEVKTRLGKLSNSELISLTVNFMNGYNDLIKTFMKYS